MAIRRSSTCVSRAFSDLVEIKHLPGALKKQIVEYFLERCNYENTGKSSWWQLINEDASINGLT